MVLFAGTFDFSYNPFIRYEHQNVTATFEDVNIGYFDGADITTYDFEIPAGTLLKYDSTHDVYEILAHNESTLPEKVFVLMNDIAEDYENPQDLTLLINGSIFLDAVYVNNNGTLESASDHYTVEKFSQEVYNLITSLREV